MAGAQIAEGRGRQTVRRVVATDPHLRLEASVEEAWTFLGIPGTSIITYTSRMKPDGSLDGAGEGVFSSAQGDMVTWKGIGAGRFMADGSIQFQGSLSFVTTSSRLTALNGIAGVFEWNIDPQGNTRSKVWELAASGASVTADASRG